MIQADQFEMFSDLGGTLVAKYPEVPGAKREGTSREAAPTKTEAATLRAEVLNELRKQDLTADETASILGRSVLSIRPRFSELHAAGKIRETTERRRNVSGKSASVWTCIAPF